MLASGSDDTYLNIWDYNPANLAKPFTLNTSVSTGHTNNIFSVKFMPHSGDRTVVTCAGDSEVRVFDLEYGGVSGSQEANLSNTRSRRFNTFFGNARWLNEGSTNARVYRSHADRAKRIVTESSPHLFLSCSEDGEVRQWDLRQPSSAYPAPYGARRMRMRMNNIDEEPRHVPPPLISYKKYALDLNSISCSGSQPHYIALGGAHLHCFLHDRRMLGRDISNEQGRPGGITPLPGTDADEGMREATRCVRRFAPNNKRRMGPHDTGHITACKISDARPNELISSWSGDHIYSFDIVRSPDARDAEIKQDRAARAVRLRDRNERKRKRANANSSSTDPADKAVRRLQKVDGSSHGLRDENDEAGAVSLDPILNTDSADVRDTLLSEAQRQSASIARSLVQLRKTLFDFSATLSQREVTSMESSSELTPFSATFTTALGQASVLLPEMEETMRTWRYPVNPDDDEVNFQNTLRYNRQAAWRFVQAAGCLSKTLDGKLQTLSAAPDPRLAQFDMIQPAPGGNRRISQASRFCYDFLKAILLWLDGGASAVLRGFRKSPNLHTSDIASPLGPDATLETMSDKLYEYLTNFADGEKPVIELGTNRFERDEFRNIFATQIDAVRAFTRALSGIELRHNQGVSGSGSEQDSDRRVMDKGAAVRFWGLKVGRSLLLEAAEGVDFATVQQAFGGLSLSVLSDLENLGHVPHTLSEDNEPAVSSIHLIEADASDSARMQSQVDIGTTNTLAEETRNVMNEDENDDDDHEQYDMDDNVQEEDSDDGAPGSDDDDDDDADDGATQQYFRRRVAYGRSRERSAVNVNVPYTSHTKVYKGHCNTRTVKDVNYYGLDDEYVVSGSDDGHFFIWDRKTGQVLNILEGDGEVVNVVQGHPYEPMIACSGIDSTVKIFAPADSNRERYDAIKGTSIANPGGSVHSSLHFGGRARRTHDDEGGLEDENTNTSGDIGQDEPKLAHNGLKSRRALNMQYEITSQNDAMRREGNGDAFVTVSAEQLEMIFVRAWAMSNSMFFQE